MFGAKEAHECRAIVVSASRANLSRKSETPFRNDSCPARPMSGDFTERPGRRALGPAMRASYRADPAATDSGASTARAWSWRLV